MEDVLPDPRRRGRRPAVDAEATRRQVLDAAVVCFGEAGYAGASLRTIAERAGLTPGSLYHHFASKQALFAAAYEYALEVIFLTYEQAVVGRGSLRSELLAILDEADRLVSANPALTSLLLRAELARDLELPRPVPYQRFVRALVDRAVARGELRAEDGPVLDRTLGALLWGFSMVGRDERGRALTIEGYRRLIEGTFATPRRRRRAPVAGARTESNKRPNL